MRDGLLVAGLVLLTFQLVQAWGSGGQQAYDARAYWAAARGDMYARPGIGTFMAYYYSPAFQQLLAPLLNLPFPAFLAGWYVLGGGALVLLTRRWLVLALIPVVVVQDLIGGNIQVLMALAIVAGFRFPAAWAFILLTKVTPGIGLLWFVVRREWRNLAIALGATAVIAAVSFVFAPALWVQWIGTLRDNARVDANWAYLPFPLLVRLPIAAAVVSFGAARGWRATVPIAATLALPALWPVNLTMLVAVIPFVRDRVAADRGPRPAVPAPAPEPDSQPQRELATAEG